MISRILNTLEDGLKVMRSNSKMLLLAILVFVFPLLFVWITQSFFTTANSNIETAEKQRVDLLHDSLAAIIVESLDTPNSVQSLIFAYTTENSDISKIKVVERDEAGFRIIFSNIEDQIGTYEKSDDLYNLLPLSVGSESYIVKATFAGKRVWQTFRTIEISDKKLYIFSEHNFQRVDSVMMARKQQSYLGLTAIFAFLIALAYWLNRQTSWGKKYTVLAEQLHERDLFSNMIAHEFRSPLTAIKGYASFLEESKTLTSDEQRFAANIRSSAERLVVLVSDFLEVARIQSGRMKLDLKEVDLRSVLKTVSEDLSALASEKNLQLVYEPQAKPVLITTDKDRMIQAITNIVSNAIKYTDTGTVKLECSFSYDEVIVKVMDTGTGISAEDQQRLFSPFTRVGGVDSSTITGSGLGMWITKQFVELLGGTVGVESIKGIGTHIVITFKT